MTDTSTTDTSTTDTRTRPDRATQFHRLTVRAIAPLTADAVAITLEVPAGQGDLFEFRAGQHLVLRRLAGGREERRTYSLCTAAGSGALQVAVKRLPGGVVSTWLTEQLQVGDEVEVLPPTGTFGPVLAAGNRQTYGLIAVGSGITPLMSIASTVLEIEPDSEVVLVYGNRTSREVMFLEELADLKDRHPGRLQVLHVLTAEQQEAELLNGRLDRARLRALLAAFVTVERVDQWYLCGPQEVVADARDILVEAGVEPTSVHRELFYAGAVAPAAALPAQPGSSASVSVLLHGRTTVLQMARSGQTVLDALLGVRSDAPYACKSGVCGTCRARCVEGEVVMASNDALEPDEVRSGVVLTCQALPVTPTIRLEFC
jgi:ring-1,2-phenylacetyl-CoA epoxidase subunit PaaE